MAQITIGIMGGGAAGYFGAITAARENPNARVILFEATSKPLKKVRISGGGRCNVTHHCFDPAALAKNYPRGSRELRGPFTRFQPRDTVQWYESREIQLKVEEDGRMFPITDDSETIASCLEREAASSGVEVRLSTPVRAISRVGERFVLGTDQGSIEVDRLLIATGSSPAGHRFARELGHTIVSPVPSLFTFHIPAPGAVGGIDPRLGDLAGVSFDKAELKLICETSPKKQELNQTGPVLITHWGLSGPAVLKLSAFGARPLFETKYQAKLVVNWLAGEKADAVRETLLSFKQENARRTLMAHRPYPEQIPKRYWQRILSLNGISEGALWAEASKKLLNRLVEELTQARFQVSGKGVFKEEFVTCGGVSLKEINFKTMESRICPGLYFAGEVLDIDGITGGFNFQAAWTTSFIAGCSMAEAMVRASTPE